MWSRLYRWELFTFSIETVALATVLAGAIQSILRQSASKAKSKKKVVLPAFVSCVPSYNQVLQSLEQLADLVLGALEVALFSCLFCGFVDLVVLLCFPFFPLTYTIYFFN